MCQSYRSDAPADPLSDKMNERRRLLVRADYADFTMIRLPLASSPLGTRTSSTPLW